MSSQHGVDEIEMRSSALTVAPAGCALLLEVELAGFGPAEAADPVTSFHLLDRALNYIDVWQVDHAAAVQKVLREGPRLRPLARAILEQPAAAWWFASAVHFDQLLARFPYGETRPRPPARVPTEQERYMQQPEWGLYTSTERDGISSFVIAAQECSRELGPLGFPHERFRLTPQPSARVFVVRSSDDWRRLCLTFPAPAPGGFSGDLVVPDFGRASKAWDAVHVTFGGLLASDQVRLDGPEGTTALQGWDAEQTVWLRGAFEAVRRLLDLEERVEAPDALR